MDKGLLKRALEDTEDPTPGYMFRDIAQWTFVDHNTQAKLTAFLFDKLKPSASVHVLAKTLKVIKILCETGHTDFQKEMQRKSDEMKQYAAYRGKQDPKYGDKLNEKVRQTAREAIDAAFSHRKETAKVQTVTGIGSDTRYNEEKPQFSTGMTVAGATTTSAGSGNNSSHPNIAPMPTTNKWAEHMASNGASSQQPGVVSSFVDAAKTGFGFWQEGVKSTEQRVMESMHNGSDFRPVELGFGPPSTATAAGASSGSGAGGWKFTEDGQGGSSGLVPKEEAKIMTPFQVEVERIAAFKSTPQRVDLSQFTAACEEIGRTQRGGSFEELAQLLDERLAQKHPWQQRLNVMTAIEALVRVLGTDSDIGTYFRENPEDVQRNVHVVQSSLKERATKVLKLLNIPERSTNQVETFSHPSAPAQQLTMATGSGTMSWASATPPSASAPSASTTVVSSQDSGMDFGGMTVKSRAGGAAVKTTEEKTKLRKRAAMVVQEEEEEVVVAPRSTAAGAGQSAQQVTSGWGSTTATDSSNGGWGSWGGDNDTTGGWGTTTATSAPPPQQAKATAASSQLDDFFGPTTTTANNMSIPTPPPQPSSQPQQPQQQQQAPAPFFAAQSAPPPQPTAAAPPSSAPAINPQMILQMQMQMQQLMSQLNLSDPNSVAQMQSMMAQQQQLMALLAASQQQQQQQQAPSAAMPVDVPVAQHSHFSAPPVAPRRQEQHDASLSAVQEEMRAWALKN